MSGRELRDLLEGVDDTHELVLRGSGDWYADELHAAWDAARHEANCAYDEWRQTGGLRAYAAYRAAADRCDAAQDAMADHVAVAA